MNDTIKDMFMELCKDLGFTPTLCDTSKMPEYICLEYTSEWQYLEALHSYAVINEVEYEEYLKTFSIHSKTNDIITKKQNKNQNFLEDHQPSIPEIEKLRAKPINQLTNEDTSKLERFDKYTHLYNRIINLKKILMENLKENKELYKTTKCTNYAVQYKLILDKLNSIEYFLSLGYGKYGYNNKITFDMYDKINWFWNSGKLQNMKSIYYTTKEYEKIEEKATICKYIAILIGAAFPFLLGLFIGIADGGIPLNEDFFSILFAKIIVGLTIGGFLSIFIMPISIIIGLFLGNEAYNNFIYSKTPEFIRYESSSVNIEDIIITASGVISSISSAKNLKGGWINN